MLRKVFTYFIFIGIAVLFSWLAYKKVTEESTIEEIWASIKEANFFWVILSMAMGYAAIMSRGIRWKLLLQPLGHHPKTWNSIHSVAVAYFSNLAVPRSGEIARCTSLYSTDHIPVDQLIGTVISERIIDFIVLFIFMILAITLNLEAFETLFNQMDWSGLKENLPLLLTLTGLFVFTIVLIVVFRKKIMQSDFYKKISSFLIGIKEGVLTINKMEKKWQFIAHTIFIWAMYAGMAIVVFQALDSTKGIPIHQGLFIMVAGGFGMVLPAPGGTGTYVYAVVLAFLALGLSEKDGGVYGLLIWLAQTLMMILGGIVGVIMVMRARAKAIPSPVE